MLHSGLPRAYLAGGPAALGYLAGYLDDGQSYGYGHHQLRIEEQPYPRFLSWEARGPSPCPLDLSLKPPPTPSTPPSLIRDDDRCEPIEVVVDDDEEERRSREEAHHRSVLGERPDDELSCSSGHSYHHHHHHHQSPIQNYLQLKPPPVLLEMSGYPYHQPPPPPLLMTPQVHAPMTPPSTPSPPQCPRRKHREEENTPGASPRQEMKQRPKKKHARRLKFDEDTSSPVSGTVILGPDEAVVTGDIDPAFNIVEVTEEARAELAKIENRLGPYQCKLCRQLHEDAFQLAQHRCSRIAHVEYRCPECDKRFSCPANLASHRRWHKPRPSVTPSTTDDNVSTATTGGSTGELACGRCDAKFNRQAALRKHVASQHPSTEQNNNTELDSNKQQLLAQIGNNETMA